MKKIALILVILALILILSTQVGLGQGGYIELPPGFSYFLCWDGSEPVVYADQESGSFAECPQDYKAELRFLPFVSSD